MHPRVEELLPKARATFSDAERQQNYAEVQKIIWENVPDMWLWHPSSILATSKKVDGIAYLPWPITYLHGVTKSA